MRPISFVKAKGDEKNSAPQEDLADLNPIEQVFAKLKHLLRKVAARTIEAVCAAIGNILGAFTPEECANYFTRRLVR